MAGSKRERDLHRQKLARQQREAAAAAERRRKRLMVGGPILAVLVVIGLVAGVAIATNDSGDDSAASPSASTPAVAPVDDAATEAVECTKPSKKGPEDLQFPDGPSTSIDPESRYSETITTNCGVIAFDMFVNDAPETTRAMTFLSDRDYYNNTECHRLTTAGLFVLQCGDPKGDGSGGAGFTFPDENLPDAGEDGLAVYPRGTVAMANSGPNTNSGQFFLVYEDSPLPPGYTRIGTITEGMPILDFVASKGTADGSNDGPPKQPLEIITMVSSRTFAASPSGE